MAVTVAPVLSLPLSRTIAVTGGTQAQQATMRGIAGDLEGRSSVTAIELRGRKLIVTVRVTRQAQAVSLPAQWEASTVAQAIFHGPVRFHLRRYVTVVERAAGGALVDEQDNWEQPAGRLVRGPPIGVAASARAAGFRVLRLRAFRHGLGGILVIRAGSPPALVRAWRRRPPPWGLSSYLEVQDPCGRVVAAYGWSPIRCWLWSCPPNPTTPPQLLPRRWPPC